MPLTALLLAAWLLDRGSLPFELFGRDQGPVTGPDAAGLVPDAGGDGSEGPPAAATAGIEAIDPDAEGAVRKFTVAVAPPEFDEDERLGAIAYPAFHTYLLEELRTIRHLEIVELPEPRADLTPEEADFYLETGGERHPGPPQPTWTFQVRWTGTREGTATWGKAHDSTQAELLKVTAREAVASLRQYPFPPTDARAVELQSMALDSELPELLRFDALVELHDIPKRFELVGRDERRATAVAGAAIVLNSQDPEIRGRAWQAMEGVEDSYLIAPLVDSLLLDPSDFVRVEATKLLARDYSEDPRAQSALQHALVSDLSPRVRSHARWESLDPGRRRELLVATLGNPDLPDRERLELIAADVTDIRNFMDRRAVSSLIEIAIRATPSSEAATRSARSGTVAATDVVPILLELLKDRTIDTGVRTSIASGLSRHLAEPGVRETFEDVVNSDSGNSFASYSLRREVEAALRRARTPAR